MKAIGFKKSLPVSDSNCFEAFEIEQPRAKGHDVLVKISAIAVNPVDYKVRQSSAKNQILETPKIIGWDAVGIVTEIGEQVTLFKKGDRVYYAGDLTRPGCNAEYQLVDERIVGHAPKQLTDADAAAMPLTSLTAWEALFDRMRIQKEKDKGKYILIIGGAGGVGSIAIQIAKKIAGLKVIATASRSASVEWCKNMGADFVVNHKNIIEEVRALNIQHVDFILDFVDLNQYWEAIVELIKPQGHIASITGGPTPIALNQLKSKSVSFSWELMYTRSMFQTDDMIEQHHILNKLSTMFDQKILKSTNQQTIKGLSATSLIQAHQQLESGTTIGKITIIY
jgi:NADPH2:quinone reductase